MENDEELLKRLRENSPLPFELVFSAELKEIKESRRQRNREYCRASAMRLQEEKVSEEQQKKINSNDPYTSAQALELYALAFSGGGIRSATFNLGILQGLVRQGLIGQFDYLSTVSGGGYIGSWLAAWIKRDGSVTKVTDRLNPDKSPDPFGEEVAPIRWLRMFSNYFAPNASIMSVDAWTVGVTWLRNTLLNQLILLLFLSALLLENGLYNIWANHIQWSSASAAQVYLCTILLLLPVTLLIGWGMRSYYKEAFPSIPDRAKRANVISGCLIGIGLLGSYLVSAWLFSRSHLTAHNLSDFPDKLRLLSPAAVVCCITLSIVAIFGRYDRCIKNLSVNSMPRWRIIIWAIAIWAGILITAAAAAFVGELCLALGWELMQKIDKSHSDPVLVSGLAFTVGPPIMLEAFSITVIARMAFLRLGWPYGWGSTSFRCTIFTVTAWCGPTWAPPGGAQNGPGLRTRTPILI